MLLLSVPPNMDIFNFSSSNSSFFTVVPGEMFALNILLTEMGKHCVWLEGKASTAMPCQHSYDLIGACVCAVRVCVCVCAFLNTQVVQHIVGIARFRSELVATAVRLRTSKQNHRFSWCVDVIVSGCTHIIWFISSSSKNKCSSGIELFRFVEFT